MNQNNFLQTSGTYHDICFRCHKDGTPVYDNRCKTCLGDKTPEVKERCKDDTLDILVRDFTSYSYVTSGKASKSAVRRRLKHFLAEKIAEAEKRGQRAGIQEAESKIRNTSKIIPT